MSSIQGTGHVTPVKTDYSQDSKEALRVGSKECFGHSVAKVSAQPTQSLQPSAINDKLLSQRTVTSQDVVAPLVSSKLINSGEAERLQQQSGESLALLMDTPWMQQRLEAGEPLQSHDLDMLCQAALQLTQQIEKGAPKHTLAWRAASLLGNSVDMSSAGQLTSLVEKTLTTLKNQAQSQGQNIPASFYAKALSQLEGNESLDTDAKKLVACSDTLKTLQENHNSPAAKELLDGLQAHVSEQLLSAARDEFKEQLKKQLDSLEKGGSKQDIVIGFELGVAAAHIVGMNAGIRYTFDATALDDTRIVDRSTVTGSLDLVLGDGHFVRADLQGSLSGSSGRVFNNLDDFVDYHANDLLPLLLGAGRKAPKNAAGIVKARKSDAQHVQVTANRPQLEKSLIAQGVLNPGDKLTVPGNARPDYVSFSEKSGSFKAQISALEDMLAGSYTLTNTRTEFRKHSPIQDAFRSSPELLNNEPDRYFSVFTKGQNLTGAEGRQWIASTAQLLDNLKAEYQLSVDSDPAKAEALKGMIGQIRDSLQEAIASLYAEYDHYAAAVNHHDSKGQDKTISNGVRDLKHRLEKNRGSNGRAEFLRSISATHTQLAKVYENSFGSGLPPDGQDKETGKLISRMEAEYRMPQMNLSNQQIKGTLSAVSTNKASQTNHVGEVKLKIPYTPLLLSAAVRKEHVEGHFNNDMNGDYLNVSFRVDAGANMQAILGSLQSGLPKALSTGGDVMFASSLPTDMTFGLDSAGQVECHFIKSEESGEYCLQYLRFSSEKGIGGATPDIPVVAAPWGDVKVKAEAAIHSRVSLKEYVGNNTLSYLSSRYNGWADGGKTSMNTELARQAGQGEKAGEDYWDQFIHNHTSQIKKTLCNMVDPDKNISREFSKRLDEIGDEDFSLNIRTSLEAYRNDPTKENYKAALAEFNEFMLEAHKLDKARLDSSFTLKTGKRSKKA
ncbi:hypothetical protein [Parendozoicomonas haliclonae]|uniref:Uncharacterized protein n=1 Tax=Parendozoicomonas haliclonae TaxID=1960125 RepID=A0A1X7AJ45_9GAMM|nr:hypothetical protein [Parendozoicomonas haliclonae]SMA45334.1 hypothetical protein EHSB41UT_01892 [Parendozoicomonas haliclonae]